MVTGRTRHRAEADHAMRREILATKKRERRGD
jgi:hypothetical protein